MANFFKKSTACSSTGKSLGCSVITEDSGVGTGDELLLTKDQVEAGDQDLNTKAHRNFHPWEKPKNAIVAGYPFGPDNCSAFVANESCDLAPPLSDLQSWIAHWKKSPRVNDCEPASRRDVRAPRMKMIQLTMMVPITRTQLVDVDVDACKKVVWDVEADPEEQQLQTILNEAVQTPEGLYR
jgi:hypothetical protein